MAKQAAPPTEVEKINHIAGRVMEVLKLQNPKSFPNDQDGIVLAIKYSGEVSKKFIGHSFEFGKYETCSILAGESILLREKTPQSQQSRIMSLESTNALIEKFDIKEPYLGIYGVSMIYYDFCLGVSGPQPKDVLKKFIALLDSNLRH